MAKGKSGGREMIFLECPACKRRNYRRDKRTKGETSKIEVKKYCPWCRIHTVHVERKK